MDYSGSMSGTKIQSAAQNLEKMFLSHVADKDYISLCHFNSEVVVDLPLMRKIDAQVNEMALTKIRGLTGPHNSTNLYDAISYAVATLEMDRTDNDWIVALTDGKDSGSKTSLLNISTRLSSTNIGLIVVGIGLDVDSSLLRNLSKCTRKGAYVLASGDRQSISDAFTEIIIRIQGHMLMEDLL